MNAPPRPTRTQFLRSIGAVAVVTTIAPVTAQPAAQRKGRAESKVKRWDVITIGNLSRNRYWGEGDERPLRSVFCTCTLVRGDGFALLADPSVADAAQMAKELDRRTGLKPKDVTAVFVTHEHGDHYAGIAHFPDAPWYASPGVAEVLNRSAKLPRRVEGVSGRLLEALDVLPTPGHTDASHSLRFDCDGWSIVVAGDAVATVDFFRDRRPFYNAVDVARSKQTMDELSRIADVIVPGHDNYFLVT